jgi:hypothetical protein
MLDPFSLRGTVTISRSPALNASWSQSAIAEPTVKFAQLHPDVILEDRQARLSAKKIVRQQTSCRACHRWRGRSLASSATKQFLCFAGGVDS